MSSTAGAGANWRCAVTSASGSTARAARQGICSERGKIGVERRGDQAKWTCDVARGPWPVRGRVLAQESCAIGRSKWPSYRHG